MKFDLSTYKKLLDSYRSGKISIFDAPELLEYQASVK